MGDQVVVAAVAAPAVVAAEHTAGAVVGEVASIGKAVAPNVVHFVVSAMLVATVVAAMGAECPAFAIVVEAFVVVVVVVGLIVDVVVEIVVAVGLIVDIVVVMVVGLIRIGGLKIGPRRIIGGCRVVGLAALVGNAPLVVVALIGLGGGGSVHSLVTILVVGFEDGG